MNAHNIAKQLFRAQTLFPDPGPSGTINVDRDPCVVALVSATAEARTLARPTKTGGTAFLYMHTDGGDITLTVTGGYNEDGDTTFTFDDAGEFIELRAAYDGTDYYWRKISDHTSQILSQTEAGFLEDVTAGTGAASKALVLDANGDVTMPDLGNIAFGGVFSLSWDSTDANANQAHIQLPTGGAVDVPVIVIGQAIDAVDSARYDGVTEPRLAMYAIGATTTGNVIEMRKSRGTFASPTVVTAGDDLGSVNFYTCVAAGEYVLGAQIRADAQATQATTRGPASLAFATATDAAPSVLTDALTISKAQLVTCAAGLTVTAGTVTVTSGDVTITNGHLNFTAASDINIAANTAVALEVDDGTTAMLTLDSRNTVSVQNWIINGPGSQTLPDGATSRMRILSVPAKTVTLAGTTQVTTENLGAQVFIDAVTYAQSGGAVTVDRVSGLHVGTPVAGASVTITANHIISTGTAGCFCTAAGTWTDTSGRDHKEEIVDADLGDAIAVLDEVEIKRFRYKHYSDGGVRRFGGIAEDVPDELMQPGREGVAARDVAWLGLAAAKYLRAENESLKARLEAIEKRLN